MTKVKPELAALAANTIRLLAADGVQKANSGHPGLPMGMADCAFVLWTQYLKYNPDDPHWLNRDRFVLSGGHGSMLLYSLLYLSGYDVKMEDLQSFRQWGSRTPGHPEVNCLPGVETTTGPLGQGFANAVGMAIAAKMTAEKFNTENEQLFGTHRIFGFAGDGDMMEGVTSEAASLAGHLQLNNLVFFYDDNRITIEGETKLAFTENVQSRFEAYGWKTIKIDGHDHEQIAAALKDATTNQQHPVLIIATTHIGFGSPHKQDTAEVHGAPLGNDELKLTKEKLGFDPQKDFYVPDEVKSIFNERKAELRAEYDTWQNNYSAWKKNNPEKDALLNQMLQKAVPDNLEEELIKALPDGAAATRALSGKIMQKLAELIPSLVGGSADLEPSTKTFLKAYGAIQKGNFSGRNFHYGVREHAMGSINNGIALYGGYIPFGSTFLVFSDYMRPSIRLAAIMDVSHVFVFTHDSIFVGEDGPTHQPVEHLAALRLIPNLTVMRPADGLETALCWAMAVRNRKGPSALLLTRQNVAVLEREKDFKPQDVQQGAYVLKDVKNPEIVILASGSEVQFATAAQVILKDKGYATRVVSVPCKELFEAQPLSYRRELIPDSVKVLAVVEAGVSFGWSGYFGLPVVNCTVDRFGASAPNKALEEKFGFSGEQIAGKISEFLK
ncbi:MAG: transketolase [Calditrichaeota bacterium]|nr:transketolase [Calditrichota bacterium]